MTPDTSTTQSSLTPEQPASVQDRVAALVKRWAHLKELPKDDDLLTVLWAPQADPFDPDGAQLLADAIKEEFAGPPVICQCITVADLTKKIKKVSDLATAVTECP